MQLKPVPALIAVLILAAANLPLRAQTTPAGSEFVVNTDTTSEQQNPVAAWNGGRALVVWENNEDGLRGRFFDGQGVPQSAEFSLVPNVVLTSVPSEGTIITRRWPAVAFLPDGGFVLSWTEETAFDEVEIFFENRKILNQDILVQRFTAQGVPAARRFRVNEQAAGMQSRSKILYRPATNDFLVVWESDLQQPQLTPQDGIFGRLLSSTGQPQGVSVKINTEDQEAHLPALAGNGKGSILVTWESSVGRQADVMARLFDVAANPTGPDFQVNTGIGPNRRPAVAADASGNFLVVWQGPYQDFFHTRIFSRPIDAFGIPHGNQAQDNKGYGKTQISPSIAFSGGRHGTFLLVWMDYEDWFPLGMGAVTLDTQGNPVGDEFWINEKQLGVGKQIGAKLETALAGDGVGHYLTPYEGFYSGDNIGILARLLAATAP